MGKSKNELNHIHEEREKTYADVVYLALAKVFTGDSWSPFYPTIFNGENLDDDQENDIYLYYQSTIIFWTALLGIANKCPPGEEPTWQHIKNNTVFGDDPLTLRAVWNTLKLLFVFIPIIPLYNCLRTLTEFLPCLLVDSIEYLIEVCEEEKLTAITTTPDEETNAAGTGWHVLSRFLSWIALPFSFLLKIIARASTSPSGFIDAYQEGHKVGGPALGLISSVISLLSTAASVAALSLALAPITTALGIDIGFHIADGLANAPGLLTFITNTATWLNAPLASTGLFFYGFLTGFIAPLAYSFFKWISCDLPDIDNKLHIASIKSAAERHLEGLNDEDRFNLHSSLFHNKNILNNTKIRPGQMDSSSSSNTGANKTPTDDSSSDDFFEEKRRKSRTSLSTLSTPHPQQEAEYHKDLDTDYKARQ